MKPIYQKDSYNWHHARGLLVDTNLQAMDIKHLGEFENLYRQRCKLAITMYKDWKKTYQSESDVVELIYGSIEGMFLKKQAEDAAHLYWIIRQDFRNALSHYLSNITTYRPMAYAA